MGFTRKAQLAEQEVELTKKNEEADRLIEIVGKETEKVTKEKAFADEEEIKVNKINIEVSGKQKDCEEDLKKAEPALIAAQAALNTLNKGENRAFKKYEQFILNTSCFCTMCDFHNFGLIFAGQCTVCLKG